VCECVVRFCLDTIATTGKPSYLGTNRLSRNTRSAAHQPKTVNNHWNPPTDRDLDATVGSAPASVENIKAIETQVVDSSEYGVIVEVKSDGMILLTATGDA